MMRTDKIAWRKVQRQDNHTHHTQGRAQRSPEYLEHSAITRLGGGRDVAALGRQQCLYTSPASELVNPG